MIDVLLDPTLIMTGGSLIGLVVIAAALLRGWQGWLELKRLELERAGAGNAQSEDNPGLGTARIELADLRERIRKLEAIASGVEL
ncbi:hypothetical protein [Erythrobacter dokdonensis]|jgi:hypothetical protein|uniref:Uncharacterized protein n=1 Tax=Erythrobacter dokdonensis DSW-74 TaxID=1300349 RepID=A0A1A7BGG5_9SPHN|nr:hypothetical protein [Erythrobacter dokdonensis]MEE4316641.1 hypothetical protein [Erythrobacter sp.]OBV11584.1 hypothetical protein I603_1027 [Erythrobacter dokdonensis DSW-74]